MDKKILLKIKKAEKKYNTLGRNKYDEALEMLCKCVVYKEISNHGVEYFTVRAMRPDGCVYASSVGFYINSYYRKVYPEDRKAYGYCTILEQLNFVNNKLVIVGHHGQLKEIDHEGLIDEFIRIHLEY